MLKAVFAVGAVAAGVWVVAIAAVAGLNKAIQEFEVNLSDMGRVHPSIVGSVPTPTIANTTNIDWKSDEPISDFITQITRELDAQGGTPL